MKNQGATLGIGLLVLLLTLGGQLQGQSLADKRIKYSYEDKALDMVFFDSTVKPDANERSDLSSRSCAARIPSDGHAHTRGSAFGRGP